MVKYIANINNYIVTLDVNGTLGAPGIKTSTIEHATLGAGSVGEVITSDGNGGWSWSTQNQTQSVTAINDLSDGVKPNNSSIGLGDQALSSNTIGSHNTAFGYQAGSSIVNGLQNTCIGSQAGGSLIDGHNNVIVGHAAMYNISVTNIEDNIAIGSYAAYSCTTSRNIAIGGSALSNNQAADNMSVGHGAGSNNTTGFQNIFIGNYAGTSNTSGSGNTAIGFNALKTSNGDVNVAIGADCLKNNGGNNNVAIGYATLVNNLGADNIAIGSQTGSNKQYGDDCISIGTLTMRYNQGHNTIAIGSNIATTTGYTSLSDCTYLGTVITPSANSITNEIVIGSNATGNGSNTITLGDTNITELYIPGLHSGASSGDVLIFDGTKLTLSTPSGGGAAEINDLTDGITLNQSIFLGTNSGINVTSGLNNVAIGHEALNSVINTSNNTAIGFRSLLNNTGHRNTAIGHRSLNDNTSGADNCGLGYNSVYKNTTGSSNCGFGYYSLYLNETGSENVAMGYQALIYNGSISQSIGIGAYSGGSDGLNPSNNHTQCIFIGYSAIPQTNSTTNEIVIGSNAVGNGSNTITLGDTNITELHIPGLHSGASSGDVLTFDGTKINLSTLPANSGTVVEPFSVSSIGGLFTLTSLTGYYTMFHTYIDVEFSRISLYTMSDTSAASGTIVAGVFSNLSFAPNTSLSQATYSFSNVTGVTEIIIDFSTVQLSPHNKYWLGISVQTTAGALYLAKSALGSTDNYFALSENNTFNGTTLSAPVSPSPSSFNFYYRLHRPNAPGGILSNSTTVSTAIEVAHAIGRSDSSTDSINSNAKYTKIKFDTTGNYSHPNFTIDTTKNTITVLTDGLFSVSFTATTQLATGDVRTTSSITLFIDGVELIQSKVHTYNRIDPVSDDTASYTHIGYYNAGTFIDYRIKLDDGTGPVRIKDNGNQLTVMKLSN